MIAKTPKPPYYAVIFSSQRTDIDEGYDKIAEKMAELAKLQDGYLGIESARSEIGITVSYWKDLESIKKWKEHSEHSIARKLGKEKWYQKYQIRICKVKREYGFEK